MEFDKDEIRAYLKLHNISGEYTDEELDSLINMMINHIQAETGRELTPTTHNDSELHFNTSRGEYNLKHYPVVEIESIFIDNSPVLPFDYILNSESGIIKFLKPLPPVCECLYVEYTSCESDEWITRYIAPLLGDMLVYNLTADSLKNATSVKEGDVSVNYDSGNSLLALINKRLDRIRTSKVLTRMV